MNQEEYTKLDSEFQEIEEEQIEKNAWYKSLNPKRIAVYGLILILVLQFVIKVHSYLTMVVGGALFIFLIIISSHKDAERKCIDCYTAMSIVHNDLNKKKEFVEDLKKGEWKFSNKNMLRLWEGRPFRWYINYTLRKANGQLEYWLGVVNPFLATMEGYEQLDSTLDCSKFTVNTKIFIPF